VFDGAAIDGFESVRAKGARAMAGNIESCGRRFYGAAGSDVKAGGGVGTKGGISRQKPPQKFRRGHAAGFSFAEPGIPMLGKITIGPVSNRPRQNDE
jgi:hypothetical protein